ncbi:MAG TPA: hypothetical protein VGZ23_09415 [bacterium]|nr:hypothetical protein [bacterium]
MAGRFGGNWHGIIGGTSNLGRVSAKLTQSMNQVSGQFTFQDLVTVPVSADVDATVNGSLIDGNLNNVRPLLPGGAAPLAPHVRLPRTGRILGMIDDDGKRITGFWYTDAQTSGGFILSRS